jgi:hypothetical protein
MKFLLHLFLLLITLPSLGQEENQQPHEFNKYHAWLTIAGGMGNDNYNTSEIGISFLLDNKWVFNINHIHLGTKAREFVLHDLKSLVTSFGINKSIKRSNSFIFSTGISLGEGLYLGKDTGTWVTASTAPFGILPNGGDYKPIKYIKTSYEYVGIYLSVQYLLRTRFYGFGFKVYSNIHKHTEYGLAITHNFGYLNKKRIK